MLPKVLCFLAIVALVAAAPYSDRQYIDQLQKDYEDDRYEDTTEDYGKIDNMQQQFQKEDGQNWELKEIEQYQPKVEKPEEGIEQTDYQEGIEQIDNGDSITQSDDKENIEQNDDKENIEQNDDKENIEQTDDKEDIEQVQYGIGDDMQDIEQVNQDSVYKPEKVEQVQQTDNVWNQEHETNSNDEDDKIHFLDQMDDLESDSAIGKLFGESTVQEQESKYGDDQDQQQTEVEHEFNYDERKLPVEDEIPSPSYKSNYGSAYQPSDPFEPEVSTKKPSWYKRVWVNTKEKARNFAHKVKETFGKK